MAFFGLSAMRRNDVQAIQAYIVGTILSGIVPVIYAIIYYFSDVSTYLKTRSTANVQVWQVQVKLYKTRVICCVFHFKLMEWLLISTGIPLWSPLVRISSCSASSPWVLSILRIKFVCRLAVESEAELNLLHKYLLDRYYRFFMMVFLTHSKLLPRPSNIYLK